MQADAPLAGEVASEPNNLPTGASEPEAFPTAPAAAAEPTEPAPPDPFASPGADPFAPPDGPDLEQGGLLIKLYGDTQFQSRSREPVKASFAAAHLDLFATADIGRVSFLSEVFFEADGNEMALDVERAQVSYLWANWLRLRAGRSHTALGYYNDTYHHGNLFELTTSRPYSVQFEDDGGLYTAHLVGAGVDGSVAARHGTFRYDLEVGNGRLADITQVAVADAGKNAKLVNLRLRYMHDSGLILGVNGLSDAIPRPPADESSEARRPYTREQVLGGHVVYMERRVHFLLEGALVRHAPFGQASVLSESGFLELGYELSGFTPYVRGEIIHFAAAGDALYQGAGAPYAGVRYFGDVRAGLRYRPTQQLALRAEAEQLSYGARHTYLGTAKLAFGF